MNRKPVIILIVLIIVLSGIFLKFMNSQKQSSEKGTGMVSPTQAPKEVEGITGVVKFTDIEGGCWYLQVDSAMRNAVKYELKGIEKEELERYRDKKVKVQGKIRGDKASICQIGTIFEVDKITP